MWQRRSPRGQYEHLSRGAGGGGGGGGGFWIVLGGRGSEIGEGGVRRAGAVTEGAAEAEESGAETLGSDRAGRVGGGALAPAGVDAGAPSPADARDPTMSPAIATAPITQLTPMSSPARLGRTPAGGAGWVSNGSGVDATPSGASPSGNTGRTTSGAGECAAAT
jgi:hypothetical protein